MLRKIPPQEADLLVRDGRAVFIDIREPEEFSALRILGARLRPLSVLRYLPKDLDQDKTAVYFCHSGNRASGAMELLAARGHVESLVMDGGINGWMKSGFPVEKTGKGIPLMRQVHIAVGMLILLGLGAAQVIPAFYVLPALAGAGLLFSGLTGTCGMAVFLKRMPWNAATAAHG
jgi:rhodanese-related sulfurtransferase